VSLVLRGVDYGPVQCASGAMGWFGEGYWYHDYVPGLSWKGCTFVSKTTTLSSRKGNMPFYDTEIINRKKHRFRPIERFPSCIVVRFRQGVVLNSVGLSGPGADALFGAGEWQRREDPFFLSFMSVAGNREDRIAEAHCFADLLNGYADTFRSPFGVQVNLSCPNTGHDPDHLAQEAEDILGCFQFLRSEIPLVPKLSVLYPVEAAKELQDLCDAICISNTIPWGQLPADIDWAGLFGVPESADEPISPLAHLGGGGLSGWPLLKLVEEWVKAARGRGVDLPINAGGGILGPKDVDVLARAGADSVFMGSIAILRGWRLRRTIRRAHKLLGAPA